MPVDQQARPDQGHPQAVEAVEGQAGDQQQVEGQEHRPAEQLDQPVPGLGPSQQRAEDHQVQVQVGDQPEAGEPVGHERPGAGGARRGSSQRGRRGCGLPPWRLAWVMTGPPGGTGRSAGQPVPEQAATQPHDRPARVDPGRADGRAFERRVAAPGPWASSTRPSTPLGSAPRGSSRTRSAAARAAGPRKRGSSATGQADRHRPHSMQSSKRSRPPARDPGPPSRPCPRRARWPGPAAGRPARDADGRRAPCQRPGRRPRPPRPGARPPPGRPGLQSGSHRPGPRGR